VQRLAGKVALITGAARGQGAAEAELFVAEGARVVLTDVLDKDGRARASELGDAATYRHLDVTSPEDWGRVVDDIRSAHGSLHVLVNNAGISRHATIEDCDVDEFEAHFRINQLGTWLGIKSSLALMQESAPGSIINVASTSGLRGSYGGGAYNASKFGVIGLSKCAAIELSPRGIRVNTICPGGIDTEMARASQEEWMGGKMFAEDAVGPRWELPMRRMGLPAEIASLALFLASEESSYCTGSEFVADGGLLADHPFSPGGKNGPQRPPAGPLDVDSSRRNRPSRA
jgi:3alpha(or 20beta)-hydroxysteroid dehydrogenase